MASRGRDYRPLRRSRHRFVPQRLSSLVVTRLLYLAGAASRRGDGARLLAGLLDFLGRQGLITEAIEISYRADRDGRAIDYTRDDTAGALEISTRAVQSILAWHRQDLGPTGSLALLGWSLGGAVLFEALARLIETDRAWHGQVDALVTVSSPLNGCAVDGLVIFGEIAAGAAGRVLCERGSDPGHRAWVRSAADRLHDTGTRVLTVAAENDVVVTPTDAVVARTGVPAESLIYRPPPRLGADYFERQLGHGAILQDIAVWRDIATHLGGSRR
jgi:hypothetical protein